LKVLYGTNIASHVTETKHPLLSELQRELGNLRANLEHWKDFMNGLLWFSFLLFYILLGEI